MGTHVNVIVKQEEHSHEHKHSHKHHKNDDHIHENHTHGNHSHSHDRNLFTIEKIINESSLDTKVKELSLKIFRFVALAESKIHGEPLDKIHFHEVGAIDSIIDIVGAAICVNYYGFDSIVCSPLHTGKGFVKCQHGLIPVPVPATLEILKENKIPFYSKGIQSELVTPTGAAIVAGKVNSFGVLPEVEVESVGYGAGTKDLDIPNLLRISSTIE